jgi:hypothetical protein
VHFQHLLITFGFAALVVEEPTVASAQMETVRSTIDSAAALNRAGNWDAVAPLTRPAMARAIPDERCELLVQTLYAGAELWRVTEVAQLLRSFDAQCAHAPVVASQPEALTQIRRSVDMPPMPSAGVDWSAVDEFWMAVDTLTAGIEPSWAQWRGLVRSPGYRIAMLSHPDLPRLIDIAFNPGRRARRDSSLAHASQDSVVITHVLKVAAARGELARFRAAIGPVTADTIAAAIKQSARFLPAGATDGRSPPFIAITIFADDGYAQEPGIVLDLYHIRDDGLTNFLAHEFNHAFSRSFDRTRVPDGARDSRLFAAIRSLRNEGIADMVDKPFPLHMSADMQWYVTSYTAAYNASPTKLRALDSLIVASTSADSAGLAAIGARAQQLLPYASHPNGAYVARTILETFGRDSLVATVASPFAFIRMFRAAQAKRGDTAAFSPAGIAALDAMERRYTAPAPSRRSRDRLPFLNSAPSDDRSSVHERRRMVWDARLP